MCVGPFVLTTFYRKKITTRRELDLRFESLVNTEGFQTTITMLLTTAVLLVSVLMTGCTSLTEPKNSTPSGTDALTESDGFGVYIKLERDDTSSIALRGFLDYERLVCEKDSYI